MSAHFFAVSPNVWCIRRASYLTCSYMVRTPSGRIVLLEAGMDSEGEDLRRGLKEAFSASPRDVSAILITHWHNDHAAGAAAIKAESGAKIYYHAGDAPQLTRKTIHPGWRDRLALGIPEHGILVLFKGLLGEAIPRAVVADQFVDDEMVIEEDFVAIHTPGHTPGHVAFFYKPEGILFAGDALAVKSNRVALMSLPTTPDVPTARKSLVHVIDRSLELGVNVICPGHREPLTHNVRSSARELRDHIGRGGRWPLLG